MKKCLFAIVFSLFSFAFAAEIPDSLYGIWEGTDRFVFFEKSEEGEENPEIVILLKEYYGWYYDRAVEPDEKSESEPRSRNSATTRNAEHVTFNISPINKAEAHKEEAFEITLNYSRYQASKIPVTILNDNMFLNFYVQDQNDPNLYRGNAKSEGIKVSQQKVPKDIGAFYIAGDSIFDIRYWLTDMDYEESQVTLYYNDDSYSVDKHLFSAGNNYSSVSGRSKKIRNVVSPSAYNEENYIFNEDKSIMILDSQPYLTKVAGKETFEDLMAIVKAANARRKTEADPIFPPNDVNWHWDLIDLLEKDNAIIQAVRARQEAFGPRPKDLSK